jgi:hypothetical protein
MKRFFLKHARLGFYRSPAFTQQLVQTLFLGLMALYLIVSVLIFGVVAGELIREFFPGRDVLTLAGAFLIYYLPIDILTRYFLQKFPSLAIRPYLLLPIKRIHIARYLVTRSLRSVFNFFPFAFVVPFIFTEVLPNYSNFDAIKFFTLTVVIVTTSNFIAFGITKGADLKSYFSAGALVVLIAGLYLEFMGKISLFRFLEPISDFILSSSFVVFVLILIPISLYRVLLSYFHTRLYLEETYSGEVIGRTSFNLDWFSRFGGAGRIMNLELRLILRSKRARAYLLFSLLMLVFPLLMDSPQEWSDMMLIMIGLFMTGIIALNHGQLMLSWNSLHFDLLISRGNSIRDIFYGKYYFLVLTCVLTWLLSLPYYFLEPRIIYFSTAMLLVNCSFSILAYMFLASFNSLRIDPNEGGAFSFSGFGAAHYLIGIPLIVVPMALYGLGYLMGGSNSGLAVLFLSGLLGVVLHRQLIDLSLKLFMQNRYKISKAFRSN